MKNTKYMIILVLIAAIILITPTVVRMFNDNKYPVNSEAYLNMRLYEADNIRYDSLQGRNIPFNALNLFRVGEDAGQVLYRIVPILLGLASILFTYLALNKQNISEKTVIAISCLIISSPIFIYVFTDFKVYSFVIFLNVLGMYFLTHDKMFFCSMAFAIIPFIDLLSGILTLIILLIYLFNTKKHKKIIKMTSIALLTAILLSVTLNIYYGYNITNIFRFYAHNMLTDIGANIGISFSTLILAIIGLMLLWENGWRTLLTYLLILMLIVASIFNDTLRIYTSFIIMLYAGFAFIHLTKRKWSIGIIKKTTILLIICSIFFSTLVYTAKLSISEPTPEYVNALNFVTEQSFPNEVILSSPTEGYFIEYYTDRMVLADDSTKSHDQRYGIIEEIASSRNLERTESMLKEYNIKYIIISKEFEPYLNEKEGLLFLIENSKRFSNIYKNEKVDVWMYNS
jgi:hypothetical protein